MVTSSKPASSLGSAFQLSEAIQVIISTAARSGSPIRLDAALRSLQTEFPEAGVSGIELSEMIVKAAGEARVTVTART
jgi:hypothetical protein